MAITYYTQEIVFDLMKKFDEICSKYDLKYSLGFQTLYGAYKLGGFLQSSASADMLMPYEDYKKFLDIVNQEVKKPYYVENYENCKWAKHIYSFFKKRSGVRLPEQRKEDERFYDYCIKIVPIVPVANTEEEYARVLNDYIHNMSVVNVTTTGPMLNSAKTKKYKKVNIPLLKENKEAAFNNVKKLMECKNVSAYKYGLLPIDVSEEKGNVLPGVNAFNRKQSKGCVRENKTYSEFSKIKFEGYDFSVVKDYEQWLKDYYGETLNSNKAEQVKGNLLILRGFEELRRMQLLQLDLMLEIKRICEKNNIAYYVFFGSLLGAVRHRGFIPWDYDADIVMLKKDYDRFFEAVKTDMNHEKFYVSVNHEKSITVHNVYARIGINHTNCAIYQERINAAKEGVAMDIFPLFSGADTRWGNFWQTWWCNYVFKPMAWAHNRAKALPFKMKNLYYKLIRFVPLKWSYRAYEHFANKYEEKNTRHCAWLIVKSNPYDSIISQKRAYENPIEVEFEGHMFTVPNNVEEMLKELYGNGYMEYPVPFKRMIRHTYFHLDTGDFEIDITSGLGEEKYE